MDPKTNNNFVTLQKRISITDVTAVVIICDNILAGIANILHVFNIPSQKCYKFPVLKQYRIHGIHVHTSNKIIAFRGNREIAILSFNSEDISFQLNCRWIINDWVWDIQWQKNENEILVFSANNVATVWNWKTQEKVIQVICQSKCLLYCGIILENEWSSNIFVCGSMFKDILIWAPSMHKNNTCKILHKLSAHKGAVFSVYYNEKLHRISSTSDDRSVKIWHVNFTYKYSSVVDCWSHAEIILMFTVYGHMSRVWKSVILDDGRFISAGEDSQLRIWNENGAAIYHWETHQGASLRCLCVEETQNIIITGSKNGGVSLWPLSANYLQLSSQNKEIEFEDSFRMLRVQDVPRRLVLSRLGQLLTVTNQGVFLIYHKKAWTCKFTDNRFASYCLFEISPGRSYVSLSSICGNVSILKEFPDYTIHKICDKKICCGRIYSFHWLSITQFIICTVLGNLEIWMLIYEEKSDTYFINKAKSFILPPCKERWLTAAVQFNGFLLVGDRDGSVHLFHNESAPLETFRKIHGRLGVSYIWRNSDEISSIGRDGFIRYWNVTKSGIMYAAADKLPVKWPVRVIQSSYGLIVLGFNEVNFEVWNVKEKKQLLSCKCGGGHRPWDFNITNHIQFVYIREKAISNMIIPLDQLLRPSVLEGFHIRDVNCIRYLNRDLIISGSEDTTVRISKINFENNSFSPISIIRSHISSVRAIAFLHIFDYYLVFSAGGRAQLKVWKIYITDKEIVKYEELASHMLNAGKKCRKPWKSMFYSFELEPRHMDLQICQRDNDHIVAYVAGSDAFWRVYSFDLTRNELNLVKEIEYPGHCILKILYIKWSQTEFIITLTTDGKVTFWNMNSMQICYQKSVHQSGINSCDYVILQDDTLALVTGGDDATLVFSSFSYFKSKINYLNEWRNQNIHEAQISGMKISNNWIVSTGCDQKIVLWKWTKIYNDITAEYINVHYSCIPDIHGFDILQTTENEIEICVYGAGFEIFTLKLFKQENE